LHPIVTKRIARQNRGRTLWTFDAKRLTLNVEPRAAALQFPHASAVSHRVCGGPNVQRLTFNVQLALTSVTDSHR